GTYTLITLAVSSTYPTPSLNRSQNLDPSLTSASKDGQTPLKSSTCRRLPRGSGVAVPPREDPLLLGQPTTNP
ncbi:hypothetical protein EDB83DRAFT_2558012, partial [Lactarius deliciosus]